uniref:Hyaluronidase n=1 Tax=Hadronyche infensa TaxID=153481 RepID=A0A1D0C0T3_HADIN
MAVFVLLLLLSTVTSQAEEDPTVFNVRWNVPTIQCLKTYGIDFVPLLRSYGILVNNGDEFRGGVNTIFYESQLGLYPHLNQTDYPVNGGIPQLGDLSAHLKKSRQDIDKIIPDVQFTGLGIIDWESWRAVWDFNWGTLKKYQEESFRVARDQHPDWTNSSLLKSAQEEWETSAKNYMLKTLQLAQMMRPQALWCYYLYPDCYNYKGQTPQEFQCPPIVIKGNNQLSWLWDEIKAVCPSLYVVGGYLEKYSFDQRTWYVNGRLQEALRVAPNSQLYPYIGYGYGITPGAMVPKDDFW